MPPSSQEDRHYFQTPPRYVYIPQAFGSPRSHLFVVPQYARAADNAYKQRNAVNGMDLFFCFVLLHVSHLQPMGLNVVNLFVVTEDLPIFSRFTPYVFVSQCKFSTITSGQPIVEFYFLAFSRFLLQTPSNGYIKTRKVTKRRYIDV